MRMISVSVVNVPLSRAQPLTTIVSPVSSTTVAIRVKLVIEDAARDTMERDKKRKRTENDNRWANDD